MKIPKLPKLDKETKIYLFIALFIYVWIALLPYIYSLVRKLIELIQYR